MKAKIVYLALALVLVFSLAAAAVVPAGPALAATTYHVATTGNDGDAGGAGDPWLTIQHAIDNATSDDTIIVHDGIYTEDLVVDTANLTLKSVNGSGATTIQLVDVVEGIDIRGNADNFTLGGAGQGFTILSSAGAGTDRNIQVVNNPSGVEISYNTIDTTGGATEGISVGAAGATGLTISNNTFIAEVGDGSIWGPRVVDVTVDDNTFTGPGGPPASGYAVEFAGVTATSPSTISGNTITGYSMGIAIFNGEGTSNLVIDGNTITGCKNGIRLGQYSPYGAGDMTTVRVTGNKLIDNTIGLLVNTGANVKASEFVIKFNNISGSTTTGLKNDAAEQVTALNNWWGHDSGPTHAANTGGTGDAVSDNVDYDPWLMAPLGTVECETIDGNGEMTNTPSGGKVTIVATGSHTVTVATYTSNPGGPTPFASSGNYWDVHLDPTADVTSLKIEFCPVTFPTRIYYWDGGSWAPCSDQTYFDGCVEVTITNSTHPSLDDLSGQGFGDGDAAVGGEVYPVNRLGILAPWLGLAALMAVAMVALVVMKRRRLA